MYECRKKTAKLSEGFSLLIEFKEINGEEEGEESEWFFFLAVDIYLVALAAGMKKKQCLREK